MSVILYATALLLLRGVSESSCYRIAGDTKCFSSKQNGQCVPKSECEEVFKIFNKAVLSTEDLTQITSREKACADIGSPVTLYCCFNPTITTTKPVTTTSKRTTTTPQPITTTSERTTATSHRITPTSPTMTTASQLITTSSESTTKRSQPITTTSATTNTKITTAASQPITTTSERTIATSQRTTTTSPTTTTKSTTAVYPPNSSTKNTPVPTKKYESFVPKTCGNHTAEDATFGWTVLIGTGHFYRRCVGTLINDGFVLTAAHCVHEVEANDITLFFGSIKVAELPQCASKNFRCQQARAEKIWIHDDFNSTSNVYNVALIKTALNLTPYSMRFIKPICLPLNTTEDDTDQAKKHILRPLIYNTSNALQEACGYSGAPIVVMDSYKLYHVVGVANHPVDCDRKRVKRDATPATEYVDWILNILTKGKKHVEPWEAENKIHPR